MRAQQGEVGERLAYHFNRRVARSERFQTLRRGHLCSPHRSSRTIEQERTHQVNEDDSVFRNAMLHYYLNGLHS